MEKAELIGYLTKDVNLTTTRKGHSVGYFTIACHRNHSRRASFFPCAVYNKFANTTAHNIGKGSHVGISGDLETYTSIDQRSGQKVDKFHVIVGSVDYLDQRRNSKQGQSSQNGQTSYNGSYQGYNGQTRYGTQNSPSGQTAQNDPFAQQRKPVNNNNSNPAGNNNNNGSANNNGMSSLDKKINQASKPEKDKAAAGGKKVTTGGKKPSDDFPF